MGIGAGGILLQPGHASAENCAVKSPGYCMADSLLFIHAKCRIQKLFCLFPIFSRMRKPAVKLQKLLLSRFFLRQLSVPELSQPFNQLP